ncbi:hypothetical protein Lalb_Chr20g0112151 [Lupinus albus]|uniref:Uncharacterized protein n=1 Tax=Lupinus albus TaxID=3870 RepID=A0A6A4NW35_LUPAL|nr:hypothetical protein Lalb_Chr20g0112151 [Lupinus albus]
MFFLLIVFLFHSTILFTISSLLLCPIINFSLITNSSLGIAHSKQRPNMEVLVH